MWKRRSYRLFDDPEHTAFDVGDGLGVDRSQLVHQTMVEGKEGEIEVKTLPHCLLCPGTCHL